MVVLQTEPSKKQAYELLCEQVASLLHEESDIWTRSSNFIAAIQDQFHFLWTGFYRIKANQLKLASFQGSVACSTIEKGKGVCGTAWLEQRSIVVADVAEFPGHIACSANSRSEIVIPLRFNKKIIGVLDIDADEVCAFDELDQHYLEKLVTLLLADGDWLDFVS